MADIDIPVLLDRVCYRYPSLLVDSITEYVPGRRLVAFKNVTVNEEFFQGHFPGAPLLPAVLMLESLTQVASLLLLHRDDGARPNARVFLRGVNDARFRRQVVPGDRLQLEIELGHQKAPLARAQARAFVGDQVVAECTLLLAIRPDRTDIHPTALVDPRATIGEGTIVEPQAR
ncbi:MAG TPA: 3-hydroxyacyl-ACP dehydratase FabZ, partial [Vicinamibacterales bacterium]|nr:3-hydroxyacyl-ACP dehydratase FabZ [Vicinamibacterales bacterium]